MNEGGGPIQKKDELAKALQRAIDEAKASSFERGVMIETVMQAQGFQKIAPWRAGSNWAL